MNTHFDLIVLGSGNAGMAAAGTVRDLGRSVPVIEDRDVSIPAEDRTVRSYDAVQDELRPDLCRYVDWMTSLAVPAEQVVDSALRKSFTFLRSITDEHEIALWLVTLVRREATEAYSDGCRAPVPHRRVATACSDRNLTDKLTPDNTVAQVRNTHLAIRQLDPSAREVFALQSLFRFSIFEIGEITGLETDAVSASLVESQARLKMAAEDRLAESGELSPDFAANSQQALRVPTAKSP